MLFVDTSVWSLAFRRDQPDGTVQVERLRRALEDHEDIVTTGLVVQEVLQGLRGPKHRTALLAGLSAVPLLVPERDDHIAAADIRTDCRRRGIQVGTIDALLAALCVRHELVMLSTDRDFTHMAKVVPLTVWADSGTDVS